MGDSAARSGGVRSEWGQSSAAGSARRNAFLTARPPPPLPRTGREGFQRTGTVVHLPSRQTWKNTERVEGNGSSRKGKGTSETLLLKRKNIRAQLKSEALEPAVSMHPKPNTHAGSHRPHHSYWVPSEFHQLRAGPVSLLQRENTYAYLLGCLGKQTYKKIKNKPLRAVPGTQKRRGHGGYVILTPPTPPTHTNRTSPGLPLSLGPTLAQALPTRRDGAASPSLTSRLLVP